MEILNDFDVSVKKAITEIDDTWPRYDGLIICGTHNPHDTERFITKIKEARESGRPFLGICFGHQLAAIEYARNVLEIADATSEEFGTGTFVVRKLPKLKVGIHEVDGRMENFWNNYEVSADIEDRWEKPKNFITVQYHPEYLSSKFNQHPILKDFLTICKNGYADGRQRLAN